MTHDHHDTAAQEVRVRTAGTVRHRPASRRTTNARSPPQCGNSSTSELQPNVEDWFESATLPRELAAELRRTRGAGHAPAGLRLRGHQRRQLRAGVPGTGGRRQRVPQLRLGAGLAVDVLDPPLRLRGAEERVAAAAGHGRGDRLLRPHRTRLRVQPGRHAHPRPPRRPRLGAQRHQDVDHQRQPRRRGDGLGADRRRDPRLPGTHRHAGVHRQPDPPQAVAAGVGDLGTGAGQRPAARVGAAAGSASG